MPTRLSVLHPLHESRVSESSFVRLDQVHLSKTIQPASCIPNPGVQLDNSLALNLQEKLEWT